MRLANAEVSLALQSKEGCYVFHAIAKGRLIAVITIDDRDEISVQPEVPKLPKWAMGQMAEHAFNLMCTMKGEVSSPELRARGRSGERKPLGISPEGVHYELEQALDGLYVTADGVRIAERGKADTPQAKTWVVIDPKWEVYDEGRRRSDA